jgi:hypothetical protein
MQEGVLIVLGCAVATVVIALLLAGVGPERRLRQLREAADEMGFTFQPNAPELPAQLFGPQATFQARNVLRGKAEGLEVVVFDLHQIVRTGSSLAHVRFSVLGFLDEENEWPPFFLRPRMFRDGLIGRGNGFVRVHEGDVAFARPYILETEPDHQEAVSELFNEEVRRHFARNTGLWIEARGKQMIYSRGRLLSGSDVRRFLEGGFRVLALLQSGDHRPS